MFGGTCEGLRSEKNPRFGESGLKSITQRLQVLPEMQILPLVKIQGLGRKVRWTRPWNSPEVNLVDIDGGEGRNLGEQERALEPSNPKVTWILQLIIGEEWGNTSCLTQIIRKEFLGNETWSEHKGECCESWMGSNEQTELLMVPKAWEMSLRAESLDHFFTPQLQRGRSSWLHGGY